MKTKLYQFTVTNGLGDESSTCIRVKEGRKPESYIGIAIRKTSLVVGYQKPHQVVIEPVHE